MKIVLFQFGPIQFEVYPLNAHEMDHLTGTDWSRKEIAGAATYREWVGEGDEQINLRGRVFPHFFSAMSGDRAGSIGLGRSHTGGLRHLDILDNIRRLGQAHLLIRGDGWKFGWFVIERLSRAHAALGADGVGQQINFDATFQRVPVPEAAGYFPSLFGALQNS